MKTQTRPKNFKPPTIKDVLVGVDIMYRPIKTDRSQLKSKNLEVEKSKAFVNDLHEYRKNFIPDVSLVKFDATDEGLELQIKISDVEHNGTKINAWEIYEKYPTRVEKMIKDQFASIEDLEYSIVSFHQGSLIVTILITFASAKVKAAAGAAIATALSLALNYYWEKFKKTPEGLEKAAQLEKIEEDIIDSIKNFIDETLDGIKNIFGDWFGRLGTGWG